MVCTVSTTHCFRLESQMSRLSSVVTAPTKFASDGVLTLVTQSERATLAYVKTVASVTSPITKRLPSIPTVLSPAQVKVMLDEGFAAWTSLLDTNKAFATDLLEVLTPAKAAPAPTATVKK